MSQEVIEITEREIEVIEVVERGPLGPVGPQANINYTVVSSAQTLSNSQNIAADTSGGTFTLTLPASPNAGDSIDIFDYSETFNTNPLTIARNGEPIESLAEDLIANVQGAYFTMIYTGSTRGWQILPRYGTAGGGGGESVLTTRGDTLYRGTAINERLPIGTTGQILKVASTGIPEWGAAPATGVTSVGVTGSDGIEVDSGSPVTGSGTIALGVNAATLRSHINVADGANNYTHPNHSGDVTSVGDGATTIANNAVTNAKLANMAQSTIKGRATESTGDPEDLSASDVRTLLNTDEVTDTRDPNAHAASHATGGADALAPSDIGAGYALTIASNLTITADATLTGGRYVQQQVSSFESTVLNLTLPETGNQVGDTFILIGRRFVANINVRSRNHDGSGFGPEFTTLATVTSTLDRFAFRATVSGVGGWELIPVDTHVHAASAITSGTLDVARLPVGTGSTEVAAGDHTHTQLHDRSHAMTGTSDHTAGNHKVFYSNGSGQVVELALGDSGKVLQSNGATSAPTWETASGGGGEVRSDFVSPYTYTGLAAAGTSESTAAWTIRRSEFDAEGSFVATLEATAVEWDDRLTASYS